jgi:hypothetical protein
MKSESSSSDPPPTVTTGQNTAGMSTSSSSYHFKEGAEKVDIAETTPPCQQEAMVTTFPQAAKAETILSSLDALAASEQLTRRKKGKGLNPHELMIVQVLLAAPHQSTQVISWHSFDPAVFLHHN